MFGIINTVGALVRRGRRFADGARSDEVLDGLPARFEAVSPSRYEDFLGRAIDHHGGPDFPALQCVWPDPDGRFPGEPGCDAGCASLQPPLRGDRTDGPES